jgi:hypothetical protein
MTTREVNKLNKEPDQKVSQTTDNLQVVSKSGNPGPGPVPKISSWPGLQLLLTWKTYIADISYKNFFFFYICLKNVIKYIILCIMFKFEIFS